MLPSEIPKLPTVPLVRGSPGIWKLLRLPPQDGPPSLTLLSLFLSVIFCPTSFWRQWAAFLGAWCPPPHSEVILWYFFSVQMFFRWICGGESGLPVLFLCHLRTASGVCFCRSFSSLVFPDYISPLNICCKAGLVVLNSLDFCLSEKLFISPSILKEILARYSNLGCRFFPFSTLNISCHSLLACRVSAERSAVKRMGCPLYVTCCFSFAAVNILSLRLVFVSLISMCLGRFLLGFILYGTLCAS